MLTFYSIAAIWIVVVSLVTFVIYGFDKRQARRHGQRISEKRLHLLALAGGFPGAFAGQQYFRHKTQKVSFTVVTGLALLLHLAIWIAIGVLAS